MKRVAKLLLLSAAVAMSMSAVAQNYPNRAIRVTLLAIVAFAGAVALGLLLIGPWAMDDREIVSRSIEALRPLLGIGGEPLFTRLYRWDRANAQHEVGHLDRMVALDRALTRHPGLYLTGSGFRGVGIPDCVADGRATAAHVAAWLPTAAPLVRS